MTGERVYDTLVPIPSFLGATGQPLERLKLLGLIPWAPESEDFEVYSLYSCLCHLHIAAGDADESNNRALASQINTQYFAVARLFLRSRPVSAQGRALKLLFALESVCFGHLEEIHVGILSALADLGLGSDQKASGHQADAP